MVVVVKMVVVICALKEGEIVELESGKVLKWV